MINDIKNCNINMDDSDQIKVPPKPKISIIFKEETPTIPKEESKPEVKDSLKSSPEPIKIESPFEIATLKMEGKDEIFQITKSKQKQANG